MPSSSSRAESGDPSSTNTTAGSAPSRCIAAASSIVKLSAPPIRPLHRPNVSLSGRSSRGCLAPAKTVDFQRVFGSRPKRRATTSAPSGTTHESPASPSAPSVYNGQHADGSNERRMQPIRGARSRERPPDRGDDGRKGERKCDPAAKDQQRRESGMRDEPGVDPAIGQPSSRRERLFRRDAHEPRVYRHSSPRSGSPRSGSLSPPDARRALCAEPQRGRVSDRWRAMPGRRSRRRRPTGAQRDYGPRRRRVSGSTRGRAGCPARD